MEENKELVIKKQRGRPKTKTDEELKETKRRCQKEYMKTYQRDYRTEVTCSCGLIVLKCNIYRHKKSNYHIKHNIEVIEIEKKFEELLNLEE